jgi:glucosylceramidase
VVIAVDENKSMQKMEGFGYALTGGSATLINQLPSNKKTAILKEVFGPGVNNLGVSFIRISIGASDLDANVFSYCDLPAGETDIALKHFNLSQDTLHLIPILKAALKINPNLKIMASPWSPPVWMKSNNNSMGGHLLPQYYETYAQYFVKYIKAMAAEGIPIFAITMQNEPEHGGNNPSLLMEANEQKVFLRDYLGPQFKKANIKTEIALYDHNADHPNYPISILDDPKAKMFASATAFHLYLGEEAALSKVYEAHPDKKIYFTEQWTGAKSDFAGDFLWHLEHIVIGTINNWSSAVIEWNLAANSKYEPHTPGGCTECKGALTIQGEDITRNVSYYIIGHISKFVPAGSMRIESSSSAEAIKTTSFITPHGKKVTILSNTGNSNNIILKNKQQSFTINLPAGSVSTIVW